MDTLGPTLLFALACNLDTVLLAAGYSLSGCPLPGRGVPVIAAATTVITILALFLGAGAAPLLAPATAGALGRVVLAGMGLWFLLDALRRPVPAEAGLEKVEAGMLGLISLSAALGVNNAGAGVAAGLGGLSPLWGGAANFFVTLAALALGRRLGRLAAETAVGRWAQAASGALLLLLALLGARL